RHLHAIGRNLVQPLLLFRRWLLEHSRRDIRRHNAARPRQQRRAKRRGESTNAGQSGNANRYGEDDKEKFASRRTHLAGGNCGGRSIRESRHRYSIIAELLALRPASSETTKPSRSVIRRSA